MLGIFAREFIGQSSKASTANTSEVAFEPAEYDGVGDVLASTNRGMTQKEQAQILASFNKGDINVLIATCIAEGNELLRHVYTYLHKYIDSVIVYAYKGSYSEVIVLMHCL